MRPVTAGPGRMVQDASFFVGLLRQKINEITLEIGRMRSDSDKATKDSAVLAQYERKYDTLIKEVRSLEGDLADYNLAMDKSRTSMDASEITYFFAHLKRRNDAASKEIDAVFMERADREKGVHRLEEQISELQKAAEARLNSLAPPLQAEYRSLVAGSKALSANVVNLQSTLERINAQVETAEAAVKRDRNRDEHAMLEKKIAHLKRERASLDDEMNSTRLDPANARERLLAKVKDDNAHIQQIEKTLRAVEDDSASKRKIIADLTADIEDKKGDTGEREKYELLFKRDQEMTEFLDRFEAMRDKELQEQRRVQDTVAALLEHISEGIERERSMPTRSQAEEMKEDLSDKSRELKSSQMTSERLQEELGLRQTELDKIATLDVKIAEELRSLSDKMAHMTAMRRKYNDVDGLRRAAASARAVLEQRVREYTKRRDMLRQQVQALTTEFDRRKAALAREPQAAVLEALEGKLELHEQTVFGLREFISTKGRESDYDGVKAEVLKMITQLNVKIQKAQLVR